MAVSKSPPPLPAVPAAMLILDPAPCVPDFTNISPPVTTTVSEPPVAALSATCKAAAMVSQSSAAVMATDSCLTTTASALTSKSYVAALIAEGHDWRIKRYDWREQEAER